MTLLQRGLITIVAALCWTINAAAHDYHAGDLILDHPWARATAPGAPVGGGFLLIHNRGERDDVLTGGEAPFTSSVEVHQSTMSEGMMRMRPVTNGLTIPAGGSVALQPGGYHLMLMGLSSRLVEGERVPVTLHFQHAGSITVEFQVDAPGKMAHEH